MIETTDIGQYCKEYDRLRGNCFLRKADVELPDRQLRLLGATLERETLSATHVLTRICREHFRNSKLRLIPISGSGTFHIIFEVHNETDCLSILKFGILPENQQCMEFSIEVWAQQKLKALDLPWLQTEWPCYDRRQADGDFQFQATAPGRTFKELLIDPELDPKKTIGAWGKTMAGFHQIKGKGAGLIKVFGLEKETDTPEGLCADWSQFLTGHLENHLDTCRQDQVLGRQDILRIQSMFSELSKEPAIDSPSLLHGDPGNGNLFAENEEISAIID
ncbi:MAG TPA: hypothetical protein EYG38_16055, partial [Verrucomicrobia bacterium]|nr:hypothetical protein [Verrucomicrobiota bacterium]